MLCGILDPVLLFFNHLLFFRNNKEKEIEEQDETFKRQLF